MINAPTPLVELVHARSALAYHAHPVNRGCCRGSGRRGAIGGGGLSIFPLGLTAFDPFTWTCVRNSLIFAVVNTLTAVLVGTGLGWMVALWPSWGKAIPRATVGTLLAAIPVFLGMGLVGLLGSPRAWPWPFLPAATGAEQASLESWRGIGIWIVWAWTTLPAAIALVALATASAIDRLEPSWDDAARLMGIRPFQAWRNLCWPLVRPSVARAAAQVFASTLCEPGAPLIFGLRRTIAFQLVESATRANPFPRVAIWALIAGLIAVIGSIVALVGADRSMWRRTRKTGWDQKSSGWRIGNRSLA